MQNLMQNYPLSALVKASWQAGVLILLVLAVQWGMGRQLEPRWRYALWFLVVLRLALPWTLPSPVSLFNLVNPNRARLVAASLKTESQSEEARNRAPGSQPQPVNGSLAAPA